MPIIVIILIRLFKSNHYSGSKQVEIKAGWVKVGLSPWKMQFKQIELKAVSLK
jgi:hypothetical protein